MQLRCSYCHTVFAPAAEDREEAEQSAGGDAHVAEVTCPNCRAEAGLEVVETETPKPMRWFAIILAAAAFVTLGGSLAGLLP